MDSTNVGLSEKRVLWTRLISFSSCKQENQFSVTTKAEIFRQAERLSTFHEGILYLDLISYYYLMAFIICLYNQSHIRVSENK